MINIVWLVGEKNMNVGHLWNDSNSRKSEVYGDKLLLVPLRGLAGF
jgi:hypothetical protein